MPSYHAPLQDMRFLLRDVWHAEQLFTLMPAFAEVSPDLIDSVLEEVAKLAESLLFPLNQSGDQAGCQFNEGQVTTPNGFKDAYKTYTEAGWSGLAADPNYGGQGFPHMVNMLVEEMLCSANVSFHLYSNLTQGVCRAIGAHASEELKSRYLPNLISGQWTGAMCLTEPHCGTDLGLVRTKAEPKDDGSYALTGTKIFITAGEHDLTENIIHLVLARVPGSPEGIKGISLFLVPKIAVNDDGSLGEHNGIHCGSIEHKMGIKGSCTCVINYDNARGFLVGELNKGMRAMFTVMNVERLAIGLQGLGLSEVSYQNARDYAKDRIQGRAPEGALHPDKAADPLIVHPDVRRMLMTMRVFNEGARGLSVWVGRQLDIASHHEDQRQREMAAGLVELFTPIVKAYFSDEGFLSTNLGVQVLGGHGYIQEWGMEQYVRDARIAQIYEGANGIQALDLLRRKVIANDGEYLSYFADDVQAIIERHHQNPQLQPYVEPLVKAFNTLKDVSSELTKKASDNEAEVGAASVDYLHLFSLVALAFVWASIAEAALNGLAEDESSTFHKNKLTLAQFFFEKILPRSDSLVTTIRTGCESVMTLPLDDF